MDRLLSTSSQVAEVIAARGAPSARMTLWPRISYDEGESARVPQAAVLASHGCGNPTPLAQLNRGVRVLDIGSGGGIDVEAPVMLSILRKSACFQILLSLQTVPKLPSE